MEEESEHNEELSKSSEPVKAEYTEIIYPPIPVFNDRKNSINRSIFSALLFVGAFYFIFNWEIEFILMLTGVILVHELGHLIAMKFFNYSDLKIFFLPIFGAYASGIKAETTQKEQTIILFAGPIPGIIIGVVFFFIGLSWNNERLITAANIFLFLNLFNLLPFIPLDGGRIIKTIFFSKNEIISKVFNALSIAAFVAYSLYAELYYFLVIPVLMIMRFSTASQITKVRRALKERNISTEKNYDDLTPEEYWLIRDEVGRNMTSMNRFIAPGNYVPSAAEPRIINVIKSIVAKEPVNDLGVGGKILVMFIWVFMMVAPLAIVAMRYLSTLD